MFQWVPEMKEYCKGVPVLLVATKIDKRDDIKRKDSSLDSLSGEFSNSSSTRFITKKEGKKMAREIHACKFIECSALSRV